MLYNLPWPPWKKTNARPSFFGHITRTNVIYRPLGAVAAAGNLRPQLARPRSAPDCTSFLTEDIGHPALRAHLHSIITLLRIAKNA